MNNLIKTLSLLVFVLIAKTSFSQAQQRCPNGDLESGNLANWRLSSGVNYFAPVNQMVLGNNGRISIGDRNAGNGLEPRGRYPVAIEGRYSIMVGDATPQNQGSRTQMVGYSFIVNPADPILRFEYAVSFRVDIKTEQGREYAYNSSQTKKEPTFAWYMVTGNNPGGQNIPATTNYLGVNLNSPGLIYEGDDQFQTSEYHIGWTCVQYNLAAYAGQLVTIFFKTTNCDAGGHWCYAYIDGLCEGIIPTPSFTMPQDACVSGNTPILMNGTNTSNEQSYFIEIQECDINMNVIPGSEKINETFTNQQVGLIDLRNWYVSKKGKQFKCNSYYKVSLTAINCFYRSTPISQKLHFICPIIDAGTDKSICCNNLTQVQLSTPFVNGYTYNWTSIPIGFSSNIANPLVSTNASTTYYLTVTEPVLGCIAKDDVDLFVNAPMTSSITFNSLPNLNCSMGDCKKSSSYTAPNPCGPTLTANVSFGSCSRVESDEWRNKKLMKVKYLWSTGETTRTIAVKAGITNYSVTISDGCYTSTATIKNVLATDYFQKPISSMYTVNGCMPDIQSKWWGIADYKTAGNFPAKGVGPAYHAYRYKLIVWDRWGHVLRCIEKCNPNGFKNGEIVWDGRDNAGNIVPIGTYNYQLLFWNCNTPSTGQAWRTTIQSKWVGTGKKKWTWSCFCMDYWTGKYVDVTSVKVIDAITVIR